MKGPCKLEFSKTEARKYHKNQDLFDTEVEMWEKARLLGVAPDFYVEHFDSGEWKGLIAVEKFERVGVGGLEGFSSKDVKKIGKRVAKNITILFENDLVHRDLHIDNIVFTDEGEPFFIDWEFAIVYPSDIPYDVFGPEESKVPKPGPHKNQKGIYWNRDFNKSLLRHFGEFKEKSFIR